MPKDYIFNITVHKLNVFFPKFCLDSGQIMIMKGKEKEKKINISNNLGSHIMSPF